MTRRTVLAVVAALAIVVVVAVVAIAQSGGSSPHKVAISLKEFTIGAPSSKLQSGETSFVVSNDGQFPHDFTIITATPGNPKPKTKKLQKGQSETVSATLKPGAYLAICTQGGGFHYANGMVRSFTVGTFNTKTFKWEE
jgi:uncharacterized cupredoxin-like copper-binding protein